MTTKYRSLWKLPVAVLSVLGIGVSGSFFVNQSIDGWYKTLNLPFFTPPDWLFAPAWTTLFVLMGISFYRIWRNDFATQAAMKYRNLFVLQMILNVSWNFLFFGLMNPLAGLIGISVLLVAIYKLIETAKTLDRISAYLLVPYILWVSFASILNLTIWWIN
jgi:translocator protein